MVKPLFLAATIGYTLVLTALTFVNIYNVPKLGSNFDDKIYHGVAYTILAILWGTYFKAHKRHYLYSVICLFAFGISTELLQCQINPNRTFETKDMLANSIGVLIGTIVVAKFNIVRLK